MKGITKYYVVYKYKDEDKLCWYCSADGCDLTHSIDFYRVEQFTIYHNSEKSKEYVEYVNNNKKKG
mgnify:CR=1 FL=1